MVLPREPVSDNVAEVQMLFRCIHSPTQQTKENRHQTGKSGDSGKDFSEQACQRCLRCGRTRQPTQTRWAGELSLLVRYAFAAEGSSAMWAAGCRFPQRMKQAASMAQACRGGLLDGCACFFRSHSSLLQPRWQRSRMLRTSFERGAPPVREGLRERPVAQSCREWREPRHQFWQGPSVRGAFASPAASRWLFP